MSQCIYCLRTFDHLTKDHFPQGNLFDEKRNVPFRTVPCCFDRNHAFSQDEENFRNLLVNLSLSTSEKAMHLFDGKITRAYKRKPSQHAYWWSQMSLVDLKTSNGLLLGKRTKVDLSEAWLRVRNVLDKYVKAALFLECGIILDPIVAIAHQWGNNEDIELFKALHWRIVDKEVFAYAYDLIPDTTNGIVATVFFDSIFFMSLVMDKDLQSTAEKKSREQNHDHPAGIHAAGPHFIEYRN